MSLRHGVMSSLLCSIHIRTRVVKAWEQGRKGSLACAKKQLGCWPCPYTYTSHTSKFNLVPRPSPRGEAWYTLFAHMQYTLLYSLKKLGILRTCTNSVYWGGSGDEAKVNSGQNTGTCSSRVFKPQKLSTVQHVLLQKQGPEIP